MKVYVRRGSYKLSTQCETHKKHVLNWFELYNLNLTCTLEIKSFNTWCNVGLFGWNATVHTIWEVSGKVFDIFSSYLFYVFLQCRHWFSSVINEHKHNIQTEMCEEENFNTRNLISALYIKYNNFKYIRDINQERKTRRKIIHNRPRISEINFFVWCL